MKRKQQQAGEAITKLQDTLAVLHDMAHAAVDGAGINAGMPSICALAVGALPAPYFDTHTMIISGRGHSNRRGGDGGELVKGDKLAHRHASTLE